MFRPFPRSSTHNSPKCALPEALAAAGSSPTSSQLVEAMTPELLEKNMEPARAGEGAATVTPSAMVEAATVRKRRREEPDIGTFFRGGRDGAAARDRRPSDGRPGLGGSAAG